jgi:hypothetical protein
MAAMRSVVIEVKDLRKSYGDFVAVDGISFEVMQGEIFGLLGPRHPLPLHPDHPSPDDHPAPGDRYRDHHRHGAPTFQGAAAHALA